MLHRLCDLPRNILPKLSEVSEPLRRLLRKDIEWHWLAKHEDAVQEIKRLVSNTPILRYYDATKSVTVHSDASMTGLRCCLLHEHSLRLSPGPEMYISDTLSRATLPHQGSDTPHVRHAVFSTQPEYTQLDQAQHLNVTAFRFCQIAQHTGTDDVLQELKSVILDGWPDFN